MALTQEQIDILKAKIAELYIDIGNLSLAKAEVYPVDDLDDLNALNQSQFDAYDDETICFEAEQRYLSGLYAVDSAFIVQADLDSAGAGSGRLFPTSYAEVLSIRATGEGGGTNILFDPGSFFSSFVSVGDEIATSDHGIFVVQGIVDDHTLNIDSDMPIDTSVEYSIRRNIIGSPYLYLRPYLTPGLHSGTGWNQLSEEFMIAVEQPLLSWFYWPIPPEILPGPVPNPAYDTYVENVNAFAEALDAEIVALQGQLDAWSDGGGGWKYSFDTTQAYTDINNALANANSFKASMDLDGSGDIDMDDFEFLNADTIMPPLLSSRDTFLVGTRTPQLSNRKTEISSALGSVVEAGEIYTGSGLYFNRYNFLTMLVDRANGTYTAIVGRDVDTDSLDAQIAFKERQITEYEALL